MTTNEDLRDRAIAHATYVQRLARGEANQLERLLARDVLPDLLARIRARLDRIRSRGFDPGPWETRRLREVEEAIKQLDAALAASVMRFMGPRLDDLAVAEAAMALAALEDSIPPAVRILIDFRSPSPRLLRAAVRSRPFQGRHLRDWAASVGAATRRRMMRQVRIGLAQGSTTEQLAARLQDVSRATRRDARAVARTAVNHVSAHAREETYKEMSDVVDRVQYVATLDERTTVICMGLDGQVFEVGQGPRPPMHINCRSQTVPVVKPLAEVLGVRQQRTVPPGQRASMNGQVAETLRYPEFLRRLPKAQQVAILGKERARLFREHKVPIRRFTDREYRPLTIDEILQREGLERRADGSFGRIRP